MELYTLLSILASIIGIVAVSGLSIHSFMRQSARNIEFLNSIEQLLFKSVPPEIIKLMQQSGQLLQQAGELLETVTDGKPNGTAPPDSDSKLQPYKISNFELNGTESAEIIAAIRANMINAEKRTQIITNGMGENLGTLNKDTGHIEPAESVDG